MKFKDTKIIKKLLKARLKFRLKSKAYLAEEAEYQNDLAALKQAVQDGLGRSYKEREGLLPLTENKFYPLIGETLYALSFIPSDLIGYIKSNPPVKQIIDSTEEEGRWSVTREDLTNCSWLVANDLKLVKTFRFSVESCENAAHFNRYQSIHRHEYFEDSDAIFTTSESELLWEVFMDIKQKEEDKIRQAKRQVLVELYEE